MRRVVPEPAGPGQESVWDYPRPPRVETSSELVEVELGGRVVAGTHHLVAGARDQPPTDVLPPARGLRARVLREAAGHPGASGRAPRRTSTSSSTAWLPPRAAWTYLSPTPGFALIAGAVSVMPGLVDRCTVDDEAVEPQPGAFYGGWVTSRVVGPFKGDVGTSGW